MLFETARGTVHAWQCGHMAHVNARAYTEFFEQACWQLYERIGLTRANRVRSRPGSRKRRTS